LNVRPVTLNPANLVLHASDLHIGAHAPEMLSAFRAIVNRLAPQVTVLSGDLTDGGRAHEYADLTQFLRSLSGDIFLVPGNHDSPVDNLITRLVSPFRQFNKLAAYKHFFECEGLLIGELRTAAPIQLRLDWSKGVATPFRVKSALDNLSRTAAIVPAPSLPPWRILVGHHPLIDAPHVRVPGAVIGGLSALQRCDAHGVDLILSGHTHESWLGRLDGSDVLLATAPTLSSPRTRGEPQGFHAYRLTAHSCDCDLWQWDGTDFALARMTTYLRRDHLPIAGTN
jgi:3',5'-cyclic AMP phosphodiesterase CpdA